MLSAQDPDRAARPHPHAADGRRPVSGFTKRSRAPMIRSARRIPRPRSRRRWALPWRAIWAAMRAIAMAVIGDGAMSAGMAFEAMNNAGHLKKRLFVVLNDNEMSHRAAGGRAVVLSVAALCRARRFRNLKAAAQGRGQPAAGTVSGRRAAGEGNAQRHDRGRHPVRGTGLFLCRAD